MRNTRAAAKMGNFPERQLPETRSTRSRLAGDPFRALVNGSSRSNSAEPMGPSSSEVCPLPTQLPIRLGVRSVLSKHQEND